MSKDGEVRYICNNVNNKNIVKFSNAAPLAPVVVPCTDSLFLKLSMFSLSPAPCGLLVSETDHMAFSILLTCAVFLS